MERLWKPLISLQLLQDKEKIGTKLVKPKMRGLLAAQTRRHVLTGCTLAIAGGLAFKHFVADARRAAYAEFYRTYDADKEFEEMRRKGLFQSC